jgi:hypothetical protein
VRRTSALPANIKEQTSFIHGFCAWGPRAKQPAGHPKMGSCRKTRAGVCSASTKSAPSTRCTATCCSSKPTLRRQRLVSVAKTGAGLSALKCASIIKVSWRIRRPRVKKPLRLKGPALRVRI